MINQQAKSPRAFISLAFSALFLLGACNTIEGAGKDVESVGETIEEGAKE